MKVLRCAIYTRKSSEEGLEQSFNSLHAQRDACSAYILSQAGEGWMENPAFYDDGGYSGGSMDRPGLAALMADIGKGLVDVVVVYKVDRLTRSLADFARIIELFDKKAVSFVSVTQAFNTTSSMGRLTLNVLLSFAQFEREVTGERIRDKIAASKQKGLWMGGRPPLGYDGVNAKLVVNGPEAVTVHHIFQRYLELGSIHALAADLEVSGVRSKLWTGKSGQIYGGKVLLRGALYHLLSNPTYLGAIRHKEKVYPNAHPPIIERELWDLVQAQLKSNGVDRSDAERLAAPVLLQGLLFDADGAPMGPVFTVRRTKRYRYYASRTSEASSKATPALRRIAMGALDDFVLAIVTAVMPASFLAGSSPHERASASITSVMLLPSEVRVSVRAEAFAGITPAGASVSEKADGSREFVMPVQLKHRQGAAILEAPGAPKQSARIDRALVRALALATSWSERLANGNAPNLKSIALSEGYCDHYAARLLPLAWLAPDLVAEILEGRQPAAVSLKSLTTVPLPVDWDDQRKLFRTAGAKAA